MTRAMILCAGLGTRLGALSDERPKPMLPICDIPILRFGIANLVGHGVRDLVINVHHKGEVIEREIGDGAAFGARVVYSHEDPILGTGGGLKHALPLLDPEGSDEPFLSINGKLIFDLDVTALLAAYRARPGLLGMMVVRRVPDARDWGAVLVRDGLVKNVLGDGEHMFCGAHVTRPSVMARLPDGESDSIRQGYLPWMHAGGEVGAFEHERGYFAEHSTPERYLASNVAFLRGETLRFPPGPLTGIDPTASIDPTATIIPPVRIGPGAVIGANAVVGPDTVIGTDTFVAPGAQVLRSVVWAGARASGSVRNTIVTTRNT
jgi:NDP-sugar pyrophosphorylase family protein